MHSFVEPSSKLEAVARISNLTNSGPEELGPGSKERKRVFINLARQSGLQDSLLNLSKPRLARAIVETLGGVWDDTCESIGDTVTLSGLSRVLESAERYCFANNLLWNRNIEPVTPKKEAEQLRHVVLKSVDRSAWHGKDCVQEMRSAGSKKWRETEWQGFYLEFRTLGPLVNVLGGGPARIGTTEFDFQAKYTWDLKVHSAIGKDGTRKNFCLLNDQSSINLAAEQTGIGFVVVSGIPTYSEEFTIWHKQMRGGDTPPRRTLKSKFEPRELDVFFFASSSEIEVAMGQKILQRFNQGKQPSGALRAPKFSLNLSLARNSNFLLHSSNF